MQGSTTFPWPQGPFQLMSNKLCTTYTRLNSEVDLFADAKNSFSHNSSHAGQLHRLLLGLSKGRNCLAKGFRSRTWVLKRQLVTRLKPQTTGSDMFRLSSASLVSLRSFVGTSQHVLFYTRSRASLGDCRTCQFEFWIPPAAAMERSKSRGIQPWRGVVVICRSSAQSRQTNSSA